MKLLKFRGGKGRGNSKFFRRDHMDIRIFSWEQSPQFSLKTRRIRYHDKQQGNIFNSYIFNQRKVSLTDHAPDMVFCLTEKVTKLIFDALISIYGPESLLFLSMYLFQFQFFQFFQSQLGCLFMVAHEQVDGHMR